MAIGLSCGSLHVSRRKVELENGAGAPASTLVADTRSGATYGLVVDLLKETS